MNLVAYLFVMVFAAVIVALAGANVTLNAFELDPTAVRDAAMFSAGFISGAMASSALAKRLIG